MSVREAFDRAVSGSPLGELDAGAVEAARALADKIDAWDVIVQWAIDDAANVEGARPKVPANDNVSLPTFLRYCEALGLTPSGRAKLDAPKEVGAGGALGDLQAQARKRRAS